MRRRKRLALLVGVIAPDADGLNGGNTKNADGDEPDAGAQKKPGIICSCDERDTILLDVDKLDD